jgi:RNA polymerase sigma-70 factor (ECF subfamily)
VGTEGDGQHDLAAAAQARVPGAFEALYDAYSGTVYGYVRGLGVPEPDDTVSEVFVAVVRGLATFRGDEDDFRRWLFTIAHRRAVDAHRARARRPVRPADPSDLPDLVADGDPTEAVEELLAPGVATAALAQLTPEQREVILLRVVADLSVADAAAVMGKQPGAIKTLQRRALAALRRIIILPAVS